MEIDFNPNDPKASWLFNVKDHMKPMSQEEIKAELRATANPFSVMMCHIDGDFNIASVIRSANSFNATEIFYYGKKKIDRRGTTGTHLYHTPIYLRDFDSIVALKEQYSFVALENNTKFPVQNIMQFDWKTEKTPMIVCGCEASGISEDVLAICDSYIEIPSWGSVRSMNCAVATSIAMFDFMSKRKV